MAISTKATVRREALERLAEERLKDSESLRKGRRFAAAVYLGVYAVGCLLKAHICKALDLDELPETYKSHHLLSWLLHSGLQRRIQGEQAILENLKKIDGIWNPADEQRNIRYIADPARYGEVQANDVQAWMLDSGEGVVTWHRKKSRRF